MLLRILKGMPPSPLASATRFSVEEASGKTILSDSIELLLLLPPSSTGISTTRRFLVVKFHKLPLSAEPNGRSRNKKTIPRVGMV